VLQLSSIEKTLGGRLLFEDAGFTINPGEKIGLVGPNGAGKTTVFNLITGQDRCDAGSITCQTGLTIAYFSQSVGDMKGRTALEEVIAGNTRFAEVIPELRHLEREVSRPDLPPSLMKTALQRLGVVQTRYEELGGYSLESEAEEILTNLGIAPEDHSQRVEDFSGGWKMRIALAKVLIVKPDLILMDEPTNYLDLETILWLEGWLRSFKGAVLMTSHDREFMNNVVRKIVELAGGTMTTYSGTYDFYLAERALRRKQNAAQVDRQQAMLKKEEDFIARFKARASHASQVQSRVKKIAKIERVELLQDPKEMSILLPELPRGGNDVIVVKNLGKTWTNSLGRGKKVLEGLDFTISRQDKVAVVGLNGAGKSTLLQLLAGRTDPTEGSLALGAGINAGYFSQYALDMLNAERTVIEEILTRLPEILNEGIARNLLGSFLFQGDDVYKKVRILSGGEKARLLLAILLSTRHNLLLLDEPTNHLDITSREVLLDALQRYQGTILIVSHDRWFLQHLTNRVLEVARGSAFIFPGNYQEYLERQ